MISPELLRKYSYFAGLDDAQLKSLAMMAEEETIDTGSVLFEEGQPALKFFILLTGTVDLFIKSEKLHHPETRKDFFTGEINHGDIFGISAVLEPYIYTATAIAAQPSSVIEFDAAAVRSLMQGNPGFAYQIMNQTAKALLLRLNASRVQLAAAWALRR